MGMFRLKDAKAPAMTPITAEIISAADTNTIRETWPVILFFKSLTSKILNTFVVMAASSNPNSSVNNSSAKRFSVGSVEISAVVSI